MASPLELAGLLPGDEAVYRRLLRVPSTTRERLTEVIGMPLAELDDLLGRLTAAGLVQLSGDLVRLESPLEALGRIVETRSELLAEHRERVEALRTMIPSLVVEHAVALQPAGGEVGVQAVVGEDVVGLIRRLIEESSGDLLWSRPDQWRLPVTREIDAMVRETLAAGRRSRAIYPARVLEQAPEVIRARARSGEQVRVVASMTTRIAVFGDTAALIPDRWGESTARRLVVREHSLVGALTALFDQTWERAMTVPGLSGGGEDPTGERRLLLLQLTRGAKDEQIARALGISLRTVRRRVADIMAELGADSRFQAGVEAVRRGWV